MRVSFRGTLAQDLYDLLADVPLEHHQLITSLFIKDIDENKYDDIFCVISGGVMIYGRFSDSTIDEPVALTTIN